MRYSFGTFEFQLKQGRRVYAVDSMSLTERAKRKIEMVFRRDQSAGFSIGMQYKCLRSSVWVQRLCVSGLSIGQHFD